MTVLAATDAPSRVGHRRGCESRRTRQGHIDSPAKKHAFARAGLCLDRRRGIQAEKPQVAPGETASPAPRRVGVEGYYDPTTGTFLTRDPLDGINGTTTVANPYHYVDNDPLNKTDPLGLRAQDADFNPTYIDPCQSYGIGFMVSGTTCGMSLTGEVDWCKWPGHWFMCIKASKLANTARRIARDYWTRNSSRWLAAGEVGQSCDTGGNLPGPDDPSFDYRCAPESSAGDAVMHMSWAALLTWHYGKVQAKDILDSHEAGSVGGPLQQRKRQMDLANNFYGQQLVDHIGTHSPTGREYHTNSFEWKVEEVVERFANSGLACTLQKRVDRGTAIFDGDFVDRSRCGLRS